MVFRGPSCRNELSASLSVGDLHLVTLRPECSSSVFPSKLYGIAAVGRPIVFIGSEDSEIAALVHTWKMGRAFSPDSTKAVATFIHEMSQDAACVKAMGERALAFGYENGSAGKAAQAWKQLLNDLALLQ